MSTFKDNQGQEWTPKLTTPVLIEASREMKLSLARILAFDVCIHELFDFIWYTCKGQAESRKMSKDDFFERVGMAEAKEALKAISGQIETAFPELKSAAGQGSGPFGLGPLTTSSSSVPTPE